MMAVFLGSAIAASFLLALGALLVLFQFALIHWAVTQGDDEWR